MASMFKKKKKSGSRRSTNDSPLKGTKQKEEVEKESPTSSSVLNESLSDSGDFSGSIETSSETEEEEDGLVFTGEKVNGRPVIKGGNIEKLVERLTYAKYNGLHLYLKVLFCFIYSFY